MKHEVFEILSKNQVFRIVKEWLEESETPTKHKESESYAYKES